MTRRYYHDEIGWNCPSRLHPGRRPRSQTAAIFPGGINNAATSPPATTSYSWPPGPRRPNPIHHRRRRPPLHRSTRNPHLPPVRHPGPRRDALRDYLTARQHRQRDLLPRPPSPAGRLKDLGYKAGDFPHPSGRRRSPRSAHLPRTPRRRTANRRRSHPPLLRLTTATTADLPARCVPFALCPEALFSCHSAA